MISASVLRREETMGNDDGGQPRYELIGLSVLCILVCGCIFLMTTSHDLHDAITGAKRPVVVELDQAPKPVL
jgi:hypothetical protein